MATPPAPQPFPYDAPLRQRMTQAHIASYRALSQQAGLSRSSLDQLRRGQIGKMRLEQVQRISHALGVSVADLIAQFADSVASPDSAPDSAPTPTSVSTPILTPTLSSATTATIAALRQEYERLRQQMASQEQTIRQQVQREALTVMESWLLMWPNAVQAAQQKPDLQASKILPLTRPLQALLQTWSVQPIGAVGETVPYDPQLHQPERPTQPGEPVQVRHVGYWHGDCLLYRAKVIPVESSQG